MLGANRKQVFISHSSKDKEVAFLICKYLEESGLACWIAPRNIPQGSDYAEELVKGIKSSSAFLLLISENSDTSQAVRNEVEVAMRYQINKFGIVFDNYKMSDFLEYHFNRFQLTQISQPISTTQLEALVTALDNKASIKQSQTLINHEHECKHNLPSPIKMVGREFELQQVVESLGKETQHFTILGMVGLGKKTLANAVAYHFMNENKFDVIIWLTAQEGSLTLNSLLDQMALIFDNQFLIRLQPEEKVTAALSLLQKKSCLFIINGLQEVTDEKVLHFLSNLTYDDAVLVTSDVNTYMFENGQTVTLSGLSLEEVVQLVHFEAKRIGLLALENAPEKSLKELHRLTSGNPYAIKLSVGQVKAGIPLERILMGLQQARGKVFDDIFAKSWSVLDTDQKQLLMSLSLFRGYTSSAALQSVSGITDWEFSEGISKLINMSLVNTNGEFLLEEIQYSVLPLTRSFSQKKWEECINKDVLIRSFVSYFKNYILANTKNYLVLITDLENIRFVVEWLKDNEPNDHLVIIRSLYSFYRDSGFWNEAIENFNIALNIHPNNNDMSLQLAKARCEVVSLYLRKGSPAELDAAELHLNEAIKVFTALSDDEGLCASIGRKARIAQKRKDFVHALEYGLEALKIAVTHNFSSRIADLEHEIGDSYFYLGNYEEAEKHYTASLNLYEKQDDKIRVVGRYNDLGRISFKLGDYQKARQFLEQAIQLADEYKKLDTLCRAHISMAEVLIKLGDFNLAQEHALKANEIAIQLEAHDELDYVKRILEEIKNVF